MLSLAGTYLRLSSYINVLDNDTVFPRVLPRAAILEVVPDNGVDLPGPGTCHGLAFRWDTCRDSP